MSRLTIVKQDALGRFLAASSNHHRGCLATYFYSKVCPPVPGVYLAHARKIQARNGRLYRRDIDGMIYLGDRLCILRAEEPALVNPLWGEFFVDTCERAQEAFQQLILAELEVFVIRVQLIPAVDDMFSCEVILGDIIGVLDQCQEWEPGCLGYVVPVIAFPRELLF